MRGSFPPDRSIFRQNRKAQKAPRDGHVVNDDTIRDGSCSGMAEFRYESVFEAYIGLRISGSHLKIPDQSPDKPVNILSAMQLQAKLVQKSARTLSQKCNFVGG